MRIAHVSSGRLRNPVRSPSGSLAADTVDMMHGALRVCGGSCPWPDVPQSESTLWPTANNPAKRFEFVRVPAFTLPL
jgi:hypothetical protein